MPSCMMKLPGLLIFLVLQFQIGDKTQTALDKFFDNAESESSRRRDKMGPESASPYHNGSLRSSISNLDSMDLTSRMQEAVHRSTLDVRLSSCFIL
jgi:hypothetical protein